MINVNRLEKMENWKKQALNKIKRESNYFVLKKQEGYDNQFIYKDEEKIGTIYFDQAEKTIWIETCGSYTLNSENFLKIIYNDTILSHFWKERRNFLMKYQDGKCWSCGKDFDEKERKYLHHYQMEFIREDMFNKRKEISRRIVSGILTLEEGYRLFQILFNNVFAYYSSTKDTALVCYGCHKDLDRF